MPDRKRSLELEARFVEKPWGRTRLPSIFGSTGGRKIGEIWFEHPDAHEARLLAKYIFTSEKLSIQVHPDDHQALAKGLAGGKNECWYVLDADEGAALGLGLRPELSPEETRAAALDGSIEQLMDWKPVKAGDFIYVSAGTIHAIGPGVVLLELQQNSDVTYRLYDYGRPRELHLDDGVAVSRPGYDSRHFRSAGGPVNEVLLDGPHFSLVRADAAHAVPESMSARRRWVMPLEGRVSAGDLTVEAGGCLLAEPGLALEFSPSALVLVGAEGSLQT